MKNIFESQNYTAIMYLSTIIVSILILFSFVSLMEDMRKKAEFKVQMTAYSVNEGSYAGEESSIRPQIVFYLIILGLITLIFLVATSLKATVIKNIEKEILEELAGRQR